MMMGVVGRLWSMSLQAGILILVILAIRFLLKKYPKVYMYFLWILAGIRLLCPVFVETPFSLQPEPAYLGEMWREDFLGSERDPQPEIQFAGNNGLQNLGTGNTDSKGAPGAPDNGMMGGSNTVPLFTDKVPDLGNIENQGLADHTILNIEGIMKSLHIKYDLSKILGILAVVYMAGIVIFVCIYFIQYIMMKRKISTAVRGKDNVWFSEKVDSAFVLGIVRPKIIMPYGLKKQEGYHILHHEKTHIKHHDPFIRLVGTLCICLHWWNPLVWLAVSKMNQDMEMFCDEAVLRNASAEEKKSYANTLLSFAERRSGLSVGLAFGESHTERRVRNLMKKRKGGILITCMVTVLTVFCIIAFMTIPGIDARGADSDIPEAGNSGNDSFLNHDPETDNLGSSGDSTGENKGSGSSIGAASGIINGLTDEDIEYLMSICPKIPEFATEQDKDEDFWRMFLFNFYTSDFDRETVELYVRQLDHRIPYVKAGYDEVNHTVEQIFGKPLSAYVEDPQDLAEDSSIIYEEGYFYISTSDSPDFIYEFVSDTDIDILKTVELMEGLNGDEEYTARVYLYLLPADNERGYYIDGKEKMAVMRDMEDGMIEGQSFDVEMNPYGRVTFAAYAPYTSSNPYEDVVFKMIKDGQMIRSLGGNSIRQDKELWEFQNVEAVAFPDLNGDGYTDVVTIVNYKFGENTISEARIYTGREERYFLEEEILEEAYNNSHDRKTISDIKEFAASPEYQDYFVRTSIYGRWRVTEHIPSDGIYALSPEEIESFENTQLVYGRYWYKQGLEDNLTVENYKKELLTAQEFEESFRVNMGEMGFLADSLILYELEGVTDSASLFGQNFYQIDKDNALIFYEGVFFRAVRE